MSDASSASSVGKGNIDVLEINTVSALKFETTVKFFYGVPLYQYTLYFEINNDPCLLIRPLQRDIFPMGMFFFLGVQIASSLGSTFLNRPQEKMKYCNCTNILEIVRF